MDRLEKLLGLVAVLCLVGLLAALLIVFLRIEQRGLILRVEGPVQAVVNAPPLSDLQVTVRMPEAVELAVRGRAEVGGGLQVHLGELGLPCPRWGEGVLVPVRWSLWGGEIVWRCTRCGEVLTGR